MNWIRDSFSITCDPARLNRSMITQFLASSYWAKGIPEDTVAKSLEHSLCFALRDGDRQIGFARVVSDYATIAYLGDVFVLPEYRGRGLAKWLIECVVQHPDLQGLRRWILATRDAHGLYQNFGFTPLKRPEIFMERHDPDVYRSACSSRATPVKRTDLTTFGTRYAAAWSSQNPAFLASFYAENGSLTVNAGQPSVGRAAIAATAQGYMTAFPDMVVQMTQLSREGGHPVFHWLWTGTNTGPGGTGKFVCMTGYEEWTVDAHGLIAESKGHYDEAEYQHQLKVGARPMP